MELQKLFAKALLQYRGQTFRASFTYVYSDKALLILHGGQAPFTVLLNVCTVQLILEVSKNGFSTR